MTTANVLCFLVMVASIRAQTSEPMVTLTQGTLRGSWKVASEGRRYASFQGIPYARPPVGEYRFREPQDVTPWAGVRDASKTLSPCIQFSPFTEKVEGSEDCLFLNVYTPKLDAGALLPVMVFIHGGAFLFGSGNIYHAVYLMSRDIVVVTINYRLGPLGFLSTGDEASPGNYGLKDQSFALKWIQNNIKKFGGNPDSVTLTGNSAGAASVHYHYLSPMSNGTFARGIAYSGASFSSWTLAVKPLENARALAAAVKCPSSTNHELVKCLKHLPAEVVVGALSKMPYIPFQHMFTVFTPTVEPPGTRNPFLTQYPFHAAKAGAMHRVPLIASVTSEEGLYPAAIYQSKSDILPYIEANWEQLASNIFEYTDTLPLRSRPEVAAKIKQHYMGGNPVSQETFGGLVKALGDRLFKNDVGKLAQIHAEKSGQPTYVYQYSFRGEKSLSYILSGNHKNYGVSHADDVILMFRSGENCTAQEDVKMAMRLVDMVYSFSTTGVPKMYDNAPRWKPVVPGSADIGYLEIKSPSNLEMRSSSDFGQRAFWDSLGFLENENYHGSYNQ